NNEVLTPVAIKEAQELPEEMVQTPPDLPPAPEPEPVDEQVAEPVDAVPAPTPAPAIAVPGLDDSSLYIHREHSQLQFYIRVLEQAL
ncbi:RNA degradosome polyphosphate kinase, partial [Pseudomonas syringae]